MIHFLQVTEVEKKDAADWEPAEPRRKGKKTVDRKVQAR